MNFEEYREMILSELDKMKTGKYPNILKKLEEINNPLFFEKLNNKEKLFIRKRISWIQLSLGQYNNGWINYKLNWLKDIHKMNKIISENKNIKYLNNLNQIEKNDKLLIWNDGGYGDLIYQLRLVKYFKNKINFQIFTNKLDYLIRDKSLIAKNSKAFDWHLPVTQIPRILNYSPKKYSKFNYDYLIKPGENIHNYNQFVGLCYKTEISDKKSINFNLLKNLFIKKNNINFVILQNKLSKEEISFFSFFKNVYIVNNLDKSLIFKDTFNIINDLKFFISVDTATTHIAGYLGKKNYLLLHKPSSYYWGYSKTKSPDYSKHIIIRQKKPGDWKSVIVDLINKI